MNLRKHDIQFNAVNDKLLPPNTKLFVKSDKMLIPPCLLKLHPKLTVETYEILKKNYIFNLQKL